MSIDFGPFKMTRKLLLSAVLVGLLGGIVWRVTEMVVYSGASTVMGGSYMGSLTLFNLFSGGDIGVFFLMTFVMFFIVGPVEEFEFRSFVHDQSARVLPLWAALTFSSIFFGLSHIPIAITVYKLTPMELLFAEISWMTAGAVFGALYMWSRNIFAVIVMHGIGNWQLSVFLWQAKTKGDGLSDNQEMIASLIVSLVANALLIVLFYAINRWYWEPQRRGEPILGGKLMAIQEYMRSHDAGRRSVYSTSVVLTLTTIFTLGILVAATTTVGTQEFMLLEPESPEKSDDASFFNQFLLENETLTGLEYLEEGNTFVVEVDSSIDRYVASISVVLTWTDEDDIQRVRTFENEGETFGVDIMIGNDTSGVQESTNSHGQPGELTSSMESDQEFLMNEITMGNTTIDGAVLIHLLVSGDYHMGTGLGLFYFNDTGNDVSYTIEIVWYVKAEE